MSVWVPGYERVELGQVTVSPDRETVLDIALTKE